MYSRRHEILDTYTASREAEGVCMSVHGEARKHFRVLNKCQQSSTFCLWGHSLGALVEMAHYHLQPVLCFIFPEMEHGPSSSFFHHLFHLEEGIFVITASPLDLSLGPFIPEPRRFLECKEMFWMGSFIIVIAITLYVFTQHLHLLKKMPFIHLKCAFWE